MERIVEVNGIELCTESFGNPADPAVLLVMGAMSSMTGWEEPFCRKIADAGRFVIRYDNRDVGRSTCCEPGKPDYSFEDMADDAVHVLDAYRVQSAHIVGISMGGMLAQMMALRHAGRVLSLTLISTSNWAPELPPMEEKVIAFFGQAGAVDWTSEQAVIDFAIGREKVLIGSKHTLDEDRIARLTREEIRRARNLPSMNNHGLLSGGEAYLTRTSEIDVPTLIVHGTEDPIIPYAHGLNLAAAIPNSRLLPLEGTGHGLQPDDWDAIVGGIRDITSAR